ncbi:Os09g0372100 [Oryza sativa Japonica Group]|uniref:Os09g0372100 protein n=1 Tax=Oryza sativa subsp. japonica TaxID=39947 RepID=Q6H4D9_ORYSJ|nr:unknown protein [Oryza sativa Japonica Group]BAD26410.1 unknown protein [Oryza sativa Japonica Group]BAF24937.1 Os09g0372100 [Oryza sativa Japonica Group]|eukprot:NP_001063023.1 Os09g0372100 [Oryza sativa Japonica Group]
MALAAAAPGSGGAPQLGPLPRSGRREGEGGGGDGYRCWWWRWRLRLQAMAAHPGSVPSLDLA